MYRTADGEQVFVVDSHIHFWDGSPANQKNRYAEGWVECFYNYHKNLSPADYVWSREQYEKYSEQQIMKDLFEEGYVDVGIFQPTYLRDFFVNGWNTTEQDAVLQQKYPDKFIVNGAWDPRDGEAGLRQLEEDAKRYNLKGVKLYTAEWKGDSRGYKLGAPETLKYLDKCVELGIVNIHIHKGPTIWPFNRDAFDVADVDEVATLYRDAGLRFIVEHCGIPRIEDFCWIAAQEPNVYGGLAVVMPFIHASPHYFAEVMAELCWWLGPDRLTFSSDYALWSPKWIIDKFMEFDFPDDIKQTRGLSLSLEDKRKIMGLNIAQMYDISVPAAAQGTPVAVPA